ncbi:mitogen-activated protein kinase [Aspergillus sclerotioniger CBS 115572]|uniref:Mitogen-activated protein kinase n=1 Tax=Aspergillus sclerotioniger CBS 115572 TaxID=1450535 RepID=A0A317XC70_9EURO|nr:mitogen-activated protein kinase [Aspergillus sclerotioniger CBS 115572]PWY96234.1 mitogen-activated protein kinase [Aspergillus sclerotioniger CBS 115572]
MPYTCQSCIKRKVKCDRAIPTCSSCSKGNVECIYQEPTPRTRKRKRRPSETSNDRLARYEKILQDNGLLSAEVESSPRSVQEPNPFRDSIHDTTKTGKLISGEGKSRYVDSSLWLNSGETNMREISEDEENCQSAPTDNGPLSQDPISGALLGVSQELGHYHPTHQDAMKLWEAYINNVEPLCKVLHIPTTGKMIEAAQECLLFSIYHFAVFSMTDEDCVYNFGQSRSTLLARYQFALRQSLVNASWLKTTEMPVMQAYVLFLIAMRTQIDPHTFWIWTGVAIRIAQRMGLHRDGEALGLSAFEVQMRRRLFWQLLPLDGYAGQVSGTGISVAPDSWDTKQPLNINDDLIYPGMSHQPEEQKGASEMIFCLTKTELSNFYTRTGVQKKKVGATIQFRDSAEIERLIDEVESTIESKYLRYCDIVNPLHVLTMGIVRSAANAVRLRNRMTTGDNERRELCTLAQKIIDTDNALYRNPNTRQFQWYHKAFFLWDALLCILTSLGKTAFFSRAESDTTWRKVSEVYVNHPEILEAKHVHLVAVSKATLEAWFSNPPSDSSPQPGFITALQSQRRGKVARHKVENTAVQEDMSSFDMLVGGFDGMDRNLDYDFNLDGVDWMFWEQL